MTFTDNFFSRRWRGQVPLTVLLWRDMVGIGTAVNLSASILAFTAFIQEAPTWLAVALYFLPMPYNLFLCAALWRLPDRSTLAAFIAAGWLAAMTLV